MKLQCGNTQCSRVFSNINDMKLHNIVVHKVRLINNEAEPPPSCCQTKKEYYIQKIKKMFTSESKKLEKECPPIQNIYLDPYMCTISSSKNNKNQSSNKKKSSLSSGGNSSNTSCSSGSNSRSSSGSSSSSDELFEKDISYIRTEDKIIRSGVSASSKKIKVI
jgi:hypothetical protein